MSQQVSDELVRAIGAADLNEVRRLMDEGANPFSSGAAGQSPLEAWLASQTLGNPYDREMGAALLARAPSSPAEVELLGRLGTAQAANLGRALGVLEHGRQIGVDYSVSYLPPQTMESSQACWALVRQAIDQHSDKSPDIPARDFARSFAEGLAMARQQMVRVPGTPLVSLRATGASPAPLNPEEMRQFEDMIAREFGSEVVNISPRGALSAPDAPEASQRYLSLAGMRPTAGHAANTYHYEAFEELSSPRVPETVWSTPSLEKRLNNALEQKDWSRAQGLIARGAQINNLPHDGISTHLMAMSGPGETGKLLALGLDPMRPIQRPWGGEAELPIHLAQSQEQFDTLLSAMKERQLDMTPFSPESIRTREFWKN